MDRQALAQTVDYLETFPVFNIIHQTIPSDGGEARVFRSVADWLVADLQQEIRFNVKTNALPPAGNGWKHEDQTCCENIAICPYHNIATLCHVMVNIDFHITAPLLESLSF